MDHLPTLIGNYLDAPPGPEKDAAATLLALAPENRPGPNVLTEARMTKWGALREVPFRPAPKTGADQ